MSAIELKYNMMEMITKVDDESTLKELFQIISEFVSQKLDSGDIWDEFTPNQRADIEEAYAESLDEANWISHEVVLKKYEKWQSR